MASVKRPTPIRGSSGHPEIDELHHTLDQMNAVTIPAAQAAADRAEIMLANEGPISPPMPQLSGDWIITIRGNGPHHNLKPGDANRYVPAFVRQLRAAGHRVDHAAFKNGNEESLHEEAEELASAADLQPISSEREP